MSRTGFLFEQSARLYQQSESVASFLLEAFGKDDEPFKKTHSVLHKSGLCQLKDFATSRQAAELAWNQVLAIGSSIDPRYAIPFLLEAVEQYYYGPKRAKDTIPWLGTAMKTAIAVLWLNLRTTTASIRAIEQIRQLVAATGAWEQLNMYVDEVRSLEYGHATFSSKGVLLERPEDVASRKAWNRSVAERGLSHRTLQDSRKVIWENPTDFLEAAKEVLDGASPSQIDLFKGTVFSEIEALPDFWIGLTARVHLLIIASQIRGMGRKEKTIGVSIFESFASVSEYLGGDEDRAQKILQSMFWQPDWHRSRLNLRNNLPSMLVERPALRIDNRAFAVGVTHIGDSVNCFVEYSVFRQKEYGGVPVAEEVFRKHVSQPFEDRVVSYFLEKGWKADHVSDRGRWLDITLDHPSDVPVPGEMDVLAIHPNGYLGILIECKVLSMPIASNKFLNLSQKLGAVDSEGFHRKLQDKARWIRETINFQNLDLLPVLVVDKGSVMGRNGPSPVLDLEMLDKLISRVEAPA